MHGDTHNQPLLRWLTAKPLRMKPPRLAQFALHNRHCTRRVNTGRRQQIVQNYTISNWLSKKHPESALWYNTPVKLLPRDALTVLSHQVPAGALPVLRGLATAQRHHQLFPSRAGAALPVIVGVSGGADSICLLHALQRVAPAWGLALHVAHLDHALRTDSGQDAAWVAALAQRLDLPLHTARLGANELTGHPGGLEAAARAARYAFLHATACALGNEAGPACVAVAHHQDDQAETVLMNFLRGSGPAGLAGMAWVAILPHAEGAAVRLVRPLLGVRRSDILAYCAAYGLSWREDASNQDTGLLRNRIRADLLPRLAEINPALVATLSRSAELFAAEAERGQRIDHAALDALRLDTTTPSAERIVLDADRLPTLEVATRRGVVRLALAYLGMDLRDAGLEAIDRLLEAVTITSHSSGPHPLGAGLAWTLLGGAPRRLSLHRATTLPVQPDGPHLARVRDRLPHVIPAQGSITLEGWRLESRLTTPDTLSPFWRAGDLRQVSVDAAACPELRLTVPQPGMKIAPLGMAGRQRSVGDLFTDHKVPVALRGGWPVVVDAAGHTVWVCGLALAHHAAITPATRAVRVLHWQPVPENKAEKP